jgi:hypothetical protein
MADKASDVCWSAVGAWRFARHALDARAAPGGLLEVAGQLCGIHAEVMSSAELTLTARVEGLEQGVGGRALWEDRTLVKTWAMPDPDAPGAGRRGGGRVR